MKKLTILFIALLFIQLTAISQPCLPEGIIFTTQAQIDSFQVNYPGCTEIEGDVEISGNGITNLIGLNVITEIEGKLEIHWNCYLINLTGLDNLTSIGDNLSIYDNNQLISLTGLENLTSVEGSLNIGIDLGYPGGYFGNPSLSSLSGLNNLNSIGENFLIAENNLLSSLSGLNGLSTIGGSLHIRSSYYLTSLAELDNLSSIGGDLIIEHISLTNLAGLNNLTYILGTAIIQSNETLESLSGLNNLDSIGGIVVYGNDLLSSLSGLNGLASINGDLCICFNNLLSVCNIESICNFISMPNGLIQIYGNAPGCNSQDEVDSLCNIVTIQEINFEEIFSIYPNPVESNAVITYTLNESSHVTLKIIDLSGRLVVSLVNEVQQQGEQRIEINTAGLPAGVYFCVLKTNEWIQTKNMIKIE